MPRASKNDTAAQPPRAAANPRYGLRGVRYEYSHSKAPCLPAPVPPVERPSLPQSIARKPGTRKTASRAASANNTTTEADPTAHEAGQAAPEAEDRDPELGPEQPNFEALSPNLLQADSSGSVNTRLEHSVAVLSPIHENIAHSMVPNEASTLSIGAFPQATVSIHDTQACTQMALTTVSHNQFSTPRRTTHSMGFASPAVFIFRSPPSWARFDQEDSQFPRFVPNTSMPFNTGALSIGISPGPSCFTSPLDSSSNLVMHRDTEFAEPGSGSGLNALNEPRNAGTLAPDVFQARPTRTTRLPAPATDFNTLFATILGTIPPVLPSAPISPASVYAPYPGLLESRKATAEATSHESLVLRDDPVPGQVVLASRNSSLPQAYVPIPRSHAPKEPGRKVCLLQSDFTYDQVGFIKVMKQRWCLYLATEDSFPINVLPAQEICISHAEKVLQGSRVAYQITRGAFDYVRRKDSNIRNGFQYGLLKVVEEGYNISTTSAAKIDELILNVNFAHTSYDLATKKIIGRYRHPCISQVIRIVLFTRRSWGRPIGIRFIRELMGDVGAESGKDLEALAANATAPVTTIALACTLILYAMHSIKAGDTSNRKPKTTKPVKFAEQKYGGHYRRILAKIKQYPRLGEVQKAYMEEIMKEYLATHAAAGEESDEELEFDDEMTSDGE